MQSWIYLLMIGMVMIVLGAVVLIRDHSLDTELLGSGLVLGAIAVGIVVVLALGNGRHDKR